MSNPNQPERLEEISTAWGAVFLAHYGTGDLAKQARSELLERYGAAVRRYLLGAVRNAEAAEELFQEFALRLVRGDFRRADPDRGRFRDFLKAALYHLVVDHQRRQGRQAVPLPADCAPMAPAETPVFPADEEFTAIWRGILLARAWEALERLESETGQPLYSVLRLRTLHLEWQAQQMADELGKQREQSVTAGWVRKRLHFAREKFTHLLLAEVAQTLAQPTAEEVDQELIQLGLLEYCKPSLGRRGTANGNEI